MSGDSIHKFEPSGFIESCGDGCCREETCAFCGQHEAANPDHDPPSLFRGRRMGPPYPLPRGVIETERERALHPHMTHRTFNGNDWCCVCDDYVRPGSLLCVVRRTGSCGNAAHDRKRAALGVTA